MDELFIAGELQETSKKNLLRVISLQDTMQVRLHFLEFSADRKGRLLTFCAWNDAVFAMLILKCTDRPALGTVRLKPPFFSFIETKND
jgi:hypothetical protein